MSDEMLLVGDDAIHGEAAYCLLDDVDLEKLDSRMDSSDQEQDTGKMDLGKENEVVISPV